MTTFHSPDAVRLFYCYGPYRTIGIEPKSPEFREGVRASMRLAASDVFAPSPYTPGTAAADAYRAGAELTLDVINHRPGLMNTRGLTRPQAFARAFAIAITDIRLRKAMTPGQVARRAGCSLKHLTAQERGTRQPSLLALCAFAKALDVGVQTLLATTLVLLEGPSAPRIPYGRVYRLGLIGARSELHEEPDTYRSFREACASRTPCNEGRRALGLPELTLVVVYSISGVVPLDPAGDDQQDGEETQP